jgi:hypothetical protein
VASADLNGNWIRAGRRDDCYFTGPIGILYAAGFLIVQEGIAAFLDPKTFRQNRPPDDSDLYPIQWYILGALT